MGINAILSPMKSEYCFKYGNYLPTNGDNPTKVTHLPLEYNRTLRSILPIQDSCEELFMPENKQPPIEFLLPESRVSRGSDENQPTHHALPRVLGGQSSRAANASHDIFISERSVAVESVYDLSGAGRDGGSALKGKPVEQNQILVLEATDGTTLIVRADKLKQDLERLYPDHALNKNGQVNLRALSDQEAAARGLGSWIWSQLSVLTLSSDGIVESAKDKALELLKDKLGETYEGMIYAGASWAGAKALMWTIESRLTGEPGLYHWHDKHIQPSDHVDVENKSLQQAANNDDPILLFIHGTASSTTTSFGDLHTGDDEGNWDNLTQSFAGRVYGYEYRSFSSSPLENALTLAKSLPKGTRLSLITHSQGGLIGDLLCLADVDEDLISRYQRKPILEKEGEFKDKERPENKKLREAVVTEEKQQLRQLHLILKEKQFKIDRYIRVAAPASGTTLLSDNFDLFLSSLLSLFNFSINLIPAVGTVGSTVLSAFRRIVLEIAEKRIDPQLIPGIEAMLPNSPLTVLLAQAHRRENIDMAVISGDADGDSGGFLKRIAIMLTDWIIFDHFDNDFVVDTQSMRAGLARRNSTREYYASGHEVSHIHYFERFDTRRAIYKWITDPDPQHLPIFNPIPTDCDIKLDRAAPASSSDAARSGQVNSNAPIVFYLPGVMGSHLEIRKENQGRSEGDRIWFDPFHLAAGGIEQLSINKKNVLPEGIFHRYYGELESYLQNDHEVVTFAYDWRKPIMDSAKLLAVAIKQKLDEIRGQPQRQVSILAHSMGGLVVRAMMTERADLWDKIVDSGGHFVMLGTPNNGSHQMVETLLGKSSAIRQLAMLDFQHDLQEIIDVVADYDGILQLLPHDEFTDSGVEAAERKGHKALKYHQTNAWKLICEENHDNWFGVKSGLGARPDNDKLIETSKFWAKLNRHNKEGGFPHSEKIAYVYGLAAHTPCGLTHTKETAGKCLHLHGTVQGDGSVSWKSGQLAGLQKDQYWYMPVPHSSLTGTQEYFSAIVDLVRHGKTRQLSQKRPRTRSAATTTYRYDAGPVLQPGAEDLVLSFFGGRPVRDVSTESTLVLDVSVRAMDLRFAQWPVMCGHYLGDSIAGAEYAIDQHLLNGALSQRERLGIYAGEIGTNTIVMNPRNQEQRKRGSAHGAIILGLGEWDEITTQKLEDATYDATLEYLLHSTECAGNADGTDSADEELAINSLLICCNSTKHITIGASIEAIVLGVCKANQQYSHNRGKTQPKRAIRKLEFIECYMDTAISAAYAVRELPRRMEKDLSRLNARLVPTQELQFKQGGGTRERLSDLNSATGYWARLMVTDAERTANHCPDECYDHWVSPAIPQKVVNAVKQQLGQSGNDDSKPNYPTTETAAERLKYVYLSERARAEALVQQRQPGLIEALIKKSIQDSRYDSDICRTLFQLMVPVDFKSTARQTEQLLLVLDAYTANLPWEMLQADEEPLAMRMAMVRQLVSTRYRRVVTSSLSKDACVIGNPSTADFYHHFDLGRDPDEDDDHDLPSLSGATKEAQMVTESLRRCQYKVEHLSPAHPDQKPADTALDVLNILFKKPYRILMIAAHGESRIKARRDGKERTGVVLSDGIMLTAAEIGQMEVVPDLVFLNCCHLAKTDNQPRAYNRLAYSLSRELIEMGVRCVIAAGWAVNDDAALTFSGTFFESFTEGDTFGKAVWKARKKTYDMHPGLNTWGAYQAYGDPNYVLHTDKEDDDDEDNWQPVAPRELEDKLKGLGIDLKQSSHSSAGHVYGYPQFAEKIQRILNRVPLDWVKKPGIQYMLADLYGSMLPEGFEQAAKAYQQAIIEEDKDCLVPIRALELLGNLESRQAETLSEKAEDQRIAANKNGIEPSVKTKLIKEQKRLLKEAEMLSDNAIKRLKGLLDITHEMHLLSTVNTAEQCQTNVERFALLGSAHKRKAVILLRQNKVWKKELQSAIHFYQKGEGVSFDLNFNPYTTINRLQLEGILQVTHESQIILAEKAQAAARQSFVTSLNFFDGAMAADAMVAIYLLNESYVQDLAGNQSIKEFLVEYYHDSVKDIRYSSKEFNSVTKQLSYLAMFLKSRAKAEPEAVEMAAALNKKAEVLTAIASALQQL
ncbi:MAG: Unknown protein [uncultured Thiotrichaceae bacterium]|uniref:Uncharacterized protein n=1 Tax=uncultured Thiotrichaceae bacterium TaxID=298394 RepID=A0A6S6SSQ7_9GAMM|nr:MAG: Unknown protein [uncultured Thiotrichaceae bacterium]